MDRTYNKDFQVHYYEIDKYQKASLLSILNYLEESAISHSEAAGFGVARLKDMGRGWVLNRWLLEIDRYPGLEEIITVETWPSWMDKFYSTREFLIREKSGRTIARARTLWIYLDIEKKRPVRIPAEFAEAYGITGIKALDREFTDFAVPEKFDTALQFTVRRNDIDTNLHVNNARYVEWMLEAVPQDVYESCSPVELEVVYKKETGIGRAVASICSASPNSTNEFLHRVTDEQSGTEHAIGRMIWKARD